MPRTSSPTTTPGRPEDPGEHRDPRPAAGEVAPPDVPTPLTGGGSPHHAQTGGTEPSGDRFDQPGRPDPSASPQDASPDADDVGTVYVYYGTEDEESDDLEDDDPEDHELIRHYSYAPAWYPRGDGPLFLGMELELEVEDGRLDRCAHLAVEELGQLGHLKYDGSLEHGFEMVTQPLSFDWAMTGFPWSLLDRLHDAGCRAAGTAGIHIHLSRAGFAGDLHAFRWLKFIHRNQDDVVAFAGRRSSEYAAFTAADRDSVMTYLKSRAWPGERYRAVNLCNADTFELRVFASSLDPATVQAFWGFADASVEYTRALSVADIRERDGWSWQAFRTWAAADHRYEALTARCEETSCAC